MLAIYWLFYNTHPLSCCKSDSSSQRSWVPHFILSHITAIPYQLSSLAPLRGRTLSARPAKPPRGVTSDFLALRIDWSPSEPSAVLTTGLSGFFPFSIKSLTSSPVKAIIFTMPRGRVGEINQQVYWIGTQVNNCRETYFRILIASPPKVCAP